MQSAFKILVFMRAVEAIRVLRFLEFGIGLICISLFVYMLSADNFVVGTVFILLFSFVIVNAVHFIIFSSFQKSVNKWRSSLDTDNLLIANRVRDNILKYPKLKGPALLSGSSSVNLFYTSLIGLFGVCLLVLGHIKSLS